MNINQVLRNEFSLRDEQVTSTIKLIDEGNTIPFIARYRKEATGGIDDVILRKFHEKLMYLRNLAQRQEDVTRLIDEQGKLSEELKQKIEKSTTMQEVEDIYAPYKQKKRTRATIAKEKGLEPLALSILNHQISDEDFDLQVSSYINEESGVNNVEEVLQGANDIVAEVISDDADVRKFIRNLILREGLVNSKNATEESSVYDMYYDYQESVKTIVPHRILALNRGEKEGFLKVKIVIDIEKIFDYIRKKYVDQSSKKSEKIIIEAMEDSYKRLIFPSIEREIRNTLTERAEERAISVFGKNLKSLLLQSPIKDKVVMGFDPAYRTGCKIAVVDKNGKLLDFTTVYPTKPQNDVEGAKKTLIDLINKYNIDIISIGNGTASRESEMFVSEMIKELNVSYVIVNEAGASVYSASELANEEHPDINVSIRGAISIGRRLQDPLAELVKIDPKSIGVGQYQHDINKKKLEETLDGVIEDAVNSVGINVNTASYPLLSHVAGITKTIAKNIVAYREEEGEISSRAELKKVKRLGPKVFEQCAGFLRIADSKNPLDNTGVHPESYSVCKKMLELLGYTLKDVDQNKVSSSEFDEKIKTYGLKNISKELEVGELTLKDIIAEVKKPGRDPRDEGIMPILRKDVLTIEDLQEGMILSGTVRNVVDFGAFVDIGIKGDGLVHISKMGKKFIKDPMEIVSVGDIVEVKVIGVDLNKHRVSLELQNN
ncbi:MAG: RNA-binding transcriptional accessory protein [Clostridioides sp.]|nr:RNA-binding transcriptional accessory protein [Clostridioides sp.]